MKAYTDLEQSKKLAEILPLESADMVWISIEDDESFEGAYEALPKGCSLVAIDDNTTPCWSLAALFSVIPEGIIENYHTPNIQKENGKYSIAYGNEELLCEADNPIDACYEMIMYFHKLNLL